MFLNISVLWNVYQSKLVILERKIVYNIIIFEKVIICFRFKSELRSIKIPSLEYISIINTKFSSMPRGWFDNIGNNLQSIIVTKNNLSNLKLSLTYSTKLQDLHTLILASNGITLSTINFFNSSTLHTLWVTKKKNENQKLKFIFWKNRDLSGNKEYSKAKVVVPSDLWDRPVTIVNW